ncbi:hypothetical protein ABT294_19165 [Nonomuraea sp. NPDC000554]|uniref:hypothetical protein n=1 Tax=Nonomuraea sp. NPDC000554 TaxID=3154259 RepID=UPI00332FC0B2
MTAVLTPPETLPYQVSGPVVLALRRKAAAVAEAELKRLASRAPDLDARSRAEVRRSIHRVVEGFLREPIVRVTTSAGSPLGDRYVDAMCELFGLERGTS